MGAAAGRTAAGGDRVAEGLAASSSEAGGSSWMDGMSSLDLMAVLLRMRVPPGLTMLSQERDRFRALKQLWCTRWIGKILSFGKCKMGLIMFAYVIVFNGGEEAVRYLGF
jgi:hypothetical protein